MTCRRVSFPSLHERLWNTQTKRRKKHAYFLSELRVRSSFIVKVDCICNDSTQRDPSNCEDTACPRGHGERQKNNVIRSLLEFNKHKYASLTLYFVHSLMTSDISTKAAIGRNADAVAWPASPAGPHPISSLDCGNILHCLPAQIDATNKALLLDPCLAELGGIFCPHRRCGLSSTSMQRTVVWPTLRPPG